MNQVYTGQYHSYQPSYNYQASRGQCAGFSYNPAYAYTANESKTSRTPFESYGRNPNSPCMGHCNPPKLYADTFNYLTENLMKPVIEEVYQDLKSITAANTIVNDSAASKMGLQSVQSDGTQQRAHANQVKSDAIPPHFQGQLHDVSAVRAVGQTLDGSTLQNRHNPIRTQEYVLQHNSAAKRNGLIQV